MWSTTQRSPKEKGYKAQEGPGAHWLQVTWILGTCSDGIPTWEAREMLKHMSANGREFGHLGLERILSVLSSYSC